jgi:glutamyl-tRNA reductase
MAMLVGILGINHKLADLKLRETLAKICEKRFAAANSIHSQHSFILLSTCNRTEIYFSSHDLAETHTYILGLLRMEVQVDFDQKLYSYFGYDCFLHLARVTSGLDSAIIAETEIQGQVKKAYETALQYRLLPKELHYLFQKALKIGKKVRSNLPFQRGNPSLEQAIYAVGEKHFRNPKTTSILFIGASEINHKILRYFKYKNCSKITLCNRSLDKATEISNHYSINVLPWNDLASWHTYDWIILATKYPDYLIENSSLTPSNKCKLIMDLSVPRNADPALGLNKNIELMNIDEINDLLNHGLEKMAHTLLQTEEVIVHETKAQVITFKKRERYFQNLALITA